MEIQWRELLDNINIDPKLIGTLITITISQIPYLATKYVYFQLGNGFRVGENDFADLDFARFDDPEEVKTYKTIANYPPEKRKKLVIKALSELCDGYVNGELYSK